MERAEDNSLPSMPGDTLDERLKEDMINQSGLDGERKPEGRSSGLQVKPIIESLDELPTSEQTHMGD